MSAYLSVIEYFILKSRIRSLSRCSSRLCRCLRLLPAFRTVWLCRPHMRHFCSIRPFFIRFSTVLRLVLPLALCYGIRGGMRNAGTARRTRGAAFEAIRPAFSRRGSPSAMPLASAAPSLRSAAHDAPYRAPPNPSRPRRVLLFPKTPRSLRHPVPLVRPPCPSPLTPHPHSPPPLRPKTAFLEGARGRLSFPERKSPSQRTPSIPRPLVPQPPERMQP